jgi:hypothetical protein
MTSHGWPWCKTADVHLCLGLERVQPETQLLLTGLNRTLYSNGNTATLPTPAEHFWFLNLNPPHRWIAEARLPVFEMSGIMSFKVFEPGHSYAEIVPTEAPRQIKHDGRCVAGTDRIGLTGQSISVVHDCRRIAVLLVLINE